MTSMQPIPANAISESPPKLDMSTRGMLDDFLCQQKREKALFERLKSHSSSSSSSRTRMTADHSSAASSASSIASGRKRGRRKTASLGCSVADLLPRGRSGKAGLRELDDDQDALIAQVEALADLERLNGVEPGMNSASVCRETSENGYGSVDDSEDDAAQEQSPTEPHPMDVDTFHQYFGEKWQLSQFWYTSDFAYRLARGIYRLLNVARSDGQNSSGNTAKSGVKEPKPSTQKVAFMCCPAAYVAFQHLHPDISQQRLGTHHTSPVPGSDDDREPFECYSLIENYLFEYDDRFALLAPPPQTLPDSLYKQPRFVHYDLNDPLAIPAALEMQFDILIVDPPYLNRATNLQLAQTVKRLMKSEESKVILVTGQSISEQACEIYSNEQTGRLRRAESIEVEHVGLKNDFGVWGNWDGVEDFGQEH